MSVTLDGLEKPGAVPADQPGVQGPRISPAR